MIIEIHHAENLKIRPFTNSPIFNLSEVNATNGTTAKLNCIESITWLNTNSSVVPFSP